MGFCFSCCRRDHTDTDSDREPLSPLRTASSSDVLPPPKSSLEKIADVVAALNAGKLPSQQQLDEALRRVLSSGILDSSGDVDEVDEAQLGQRDLGEAERRVVDCAREACQALLQFGMEKNGDDRIQEVIHQLRKLSFESSPVQAGIALDIVEPENAVDAATIAQELPSQQEVSSDTATLLRSVYSLLYVLATSAAFRLVLSDVLLIARETAADVAAGVEQVAATVEKAAENVEETVRPGGGTVDDVREKASEVGERVVVELEGSGPVAGRVRETKAELQHESPDEIREATIRRLQEAMERAHANPSFQAALRTILSLFRKYFDKVRHAVAVASTAEAPTVDLTPVTWADPQLISVFGDIKVLLKRAASGHPLDPLLDALSAVVVDVVKIPADTLSGQDADDTAELREWFTALGAWLDNALAEPSYATSDAGREHAGELYDRARAQVALAKSEDPESELPRWLQHLCTLLDETDAYLSALSKDRTTRLLVDALSALSSSMADAGATAVSVAPGLARAPAREAEQSAIRGVVLWLLPRILRAINALPMPRVEYVDDTVEAAIDALLLTAPRGRRGGAEVLGMQASLAPDRVRLETWNETVVEVDNMVPVGHTSIGWTGVGTARGSAGLMSLFAGSGDYHPSAHHRARTTTRVETRTRTRARLRMDGLRIAAHDVGYYVRYNGARCCGARVPCTAYEDEGLVSVEVGAAGGDAREVKGTGVSVDIELEFDAGEGERRGGWAEWFTGSASRADPEDQPAPLFRVTSVHVDVSGLEIRLAYTRHWILNALLVQPLAAPIARKAVKWVLEGQIKGALEGLARFGGRVKERARTKRREGEGSDGKEGRGGTVEDWVWAVAEEVGVSGKAEDDLDGSGDDGTEGDMEVDVDAEDAPLVETHTHATAKGIVRQTITHAPGTSCEGDAASPGAGAGAESVLTIGIGAQVLPGKGVPYRTEGAPHEESEWEGVKARTAEEARGALEDVVEGGERLEEDVRAGVEGAQRTREEVREAARRADVRNRVEGRRGGWRSRAFDFGMK
ncbi:hypothetical protein BV20DRAFT_1077187 [Pilatotrama ljubarskyi]|nr:hypothetical protein BV20DRAFT_1077187 [Pilatotrama ljubarskyi]